MANLRAQIELDEQELAQLGHSQKESRHLREHNHGQNSELHQLEAEYAQYEQQLHGSVQKVDSLRTQLETMYQRRASATDTGISSKQKQHINANAFTGTATNGKINEHRPKASVSPFKVFNQNNSLEIPKIST
jgi:predicted nuclease with TOPRIM domain